MRFIRIQKGNLFQLLRFVRDPIDWVDSGLRNFLLLKLGFSLLISSSALVQERS